MRALYNRDWQLTRHSPDSADYSHSLIQCNASTSCCRVKSKQSRRQGGTMPEKLHFSLLHCMWNAVVYTGRSADPLSCIKMVPEPEEEDQREWNCPLCNSTLECRAGTHLFCPGLELREQWFRERRRETPGGIPPKTLGVAGSGLRKHWNAWECSGCFSITPEITSMQIQCVWTGKSLTVKHFHSLFKMHVRVSKKWEKDHRVLLSWVP